MKQLLTITDINAIGIMLSARTLKRLEHTDQFPKRLKIGRQKVAWLQTEVQEWLQVKSQQR